jgi:ankyrin repeat protein
MYGALSTLEGNLVVKIDKVYSAIHDKLYDSMAYYFGGEMSELIIENAHCDFISDRFLWKANDNRTENITYTIFIKDEQIDIYIKRILRDWSEGKVLAVFKNRNMKSPSFNAKLIDHLSRHDHSYQENLAHMRDEYIQDSTLLQSCFLGDPDLTRWILKHTVGDSGNSSKRQGEIDVVNMCRQDGSSPLLIACQNHHTEIVEMLLESEADINKCRDSGAPPLYMACQNGHLDIVEKLLDKKVNTDVNKCTNNGGSPLYIACQKGHVKIVKILLTNGADINNSLKDGSLPLHVACNFNHIDVVEEILEVQNPEFDIDLCDNKGWTSLYFACEKGYTNIARILLEHHADPRKCNINGYSPFIVAEHNGLKEILDIIEQHSSHEIR